MVDYEPHFAALAGTALARWPAILRPHVAAALDPGAHGDIAAWQAALTALPAIAPASLDLAADCIRIGEAGQLTATQQEALAGQLMAFHPWRKGPFCLFGIHIDTEWRSDWKWRRVREAVDLSGRRVLDVGCGNGYYGWRMLGDGAERVIGIDPTLRYVAQYAALAHFIGPTANCVLPLRLEALPEGTGGFDTVFSMGVLYHRRDPQEHLQRLKAHLSADGELLLETLVLEGSDEQVLVPKGRYAKMRNVWAIPSVPTLKGWLERAGLRDVRTLDVTPTTVAEQRPTAWMRFESLPDFLAPDDLTRTVEGHPAPVRALLAARR